MLTVTEKLRESYQKEYTKLNTAQREAVDAIEGPVMVIAGPGTGKTQILACRIAKILLETDTAPDNILCLTFTDAGVVAMRKRLVQFLGSDAYKVNIHTFHSFCNKVIQEHGRTLKKPDLEPLSDLERVQFVKELIDGFTNDNPLKRLKGEAYYDLGNLSSIFSTIKKEAWDPQFLKTKIDHYIEVTIPENFHLKKKPEELSQKGKDEIKKFVRTRAAVEAFPTYQAILNKNARYDFDDMINWVIKLFEEQPEVLLSYQESMQYILVDEYQDTSGSQNRIVELLTSFWENNPNLFVVGDDDQSIYRFQGANIENMMAIRERLSENLKTVVLTQNYRSVQPILNAASALIVQNRKRLIGKIDGLTKNLSSAKPGYQNLTIIPEIRVYENEFSENAHIAHSINKLIKSGVNPGHIAVLYREHKFGDELQKFLHLAQVPIYVKRSLNLLEDIFIKKILNICRYIDMENDMANGGEYLLFEILHYDFFSLSPVEIARLTRDKKGSLREYISAIGAVQSGMLFPTDETSGKIGKLSEMLNQLQKDSYNLPFQQWFEKLINETGILAMITTHEEKIWLMEKLSCLFNYIKEETHRHPLMSLKEFIQLIDLMVDNDLPLSLIQTTGNETGVNLMSCHGSKGLEFEYVFFLNARADIWEEKKKTRRGFPLPPSAFEGGDQDAAISKEEDKEELRRLFFVAMTRAEKHLYISYSRLKNDGKESMPSMFLEEIRISNEVKDISIELDEEIRFDYQALRFGVINKPVLEQAEKSYIDLLLSRFVMNVSALNNYLDCPIGFYYTNLVKVPGAKSESASFGTAVHAALKTVYDEGKAKDHFPPLAFLHNQFRVALAREREHFNNESFSRYTDHGLKVLAAYYEHGFNNVKPPKLLLTEYKLDGVALDDIPLRGFTDLIRFDGNDIVITDFKTGDFANALKKFKIPGADVKQPHGGDYWRQAVFYKILVDLLPKKWKVQHVEFEFIEPDKNGNWQKQRLVISVEDVLQVQQQIREVWEKIKKHDFYTGCGKPECNWCNFTKENKIYLKLEEEEPGQEVLI